MRARSWRRAIHEAAGLTLLEVLVAMLLTSVMLPVLIQGFVEAALRQHVGRVESLARQRARELLDELRARRPAELDSLATTPVTRGVDALARSQLRELVDRYRETLSVATATRCLRLRIRLDFRARGQKMDRVMCLEEVCFRGDENLMVR